jgi:tripartite-type tricarboxylate transporter receptor subunit TctC
MFSGRQNLRIFAWIPGLAVFAADCALSQPYPNRVVRIVTAEAGGGSDLPTRVIAQALAPSLGQAIVIDNRGGGVIAGEVVAKSPADGYTLLFYGNTLWTMPLMRSHIAYDPAKDFAPIVLAIFTPTMCAVHPSLPVKTVKELVSLAKARPGQLNYASAALGTGNHLAAELFKSMAGVNLVRIGYKGYTSAQNATIGGETQVFFPIAGPGMEQVKAGRLRGLAVTSAQETRLAPGLPTLAAAANLPGYESVFRAGLFAPTGTPPAVIARWNKEVVQAMQRPEIKERLFSMGMEPVGGTPEDFAATIRKEVAVIGKVIKEANIRDE